jgi:branched-chain amino acid transport system ATP-binding protein
MGVPNDPLVLRDVTVRRDGVTVLDRVSVTVPAGRIVGVVGANGAGKTTLLDVIDGTLTVDEGSVSRPDGTIGRLRQDERLDDDAVVIDTVAPKAVPSRGAALAEAFGLRRANTRRLAPAARDTALAHLRALGLDRYAAEAAGPLPLTVRRLVLLARCLVGDPQIVLLDEPAAGLAANEIDELAGIIRALPKRHGRPCRVLLVAHHMDLISAVCDEVLLMHEGRITGHGTPSEIRNSDEFARTFLGTVG